MQRVAVGIGEGGFLGADRIAGAGTVVDDDALAERLAEAIGDDPRDDIDRAARGVGTMILIGRFG